MDKREVLRVKKKAVQYSDRVLDVRIRDRVVATFVVGCVTNYRMVDRGKMDADLMGTTGLDLDLYKRELLKPLTHLPDRKCMTPVRGDGHLCPVPAVACKRSIDRPGIFPRTAVDERDVRFEN